MHLRGAASCLPEGDRQGRLHRPFRKRTGYAIGISFAPDWGEGGIIGLYKGVITVLQPGMAFHLPPALRIYGRFTVGVSETIVVTDTGYRALGAIDRALCGCAAGGQFIRYRKEARP